MRSGETAPGCSSDRRTRRSAAGYGRGRSSTPYTTENTAVVAPIPSASVSSPAVVKPLFRRIIATA
jgi:hypothetical protein